MSRFLLRFSSALPLLALLACKLTKDDEQTDRPLPTPEPASTTPPTRPTENEPPRAERPKEPPPREPSPGASPSPKPTGPAPSPTAPTPSTREARPARRRCPEPRVDAGMQDCLRRLPHRLHSVTCERERASSLAVYFLAATAVHQREHSAAESFHSRRAEARGNRDGNERLRRYGPSSRGLRHARGIPNSRQSSAKLSCPSPSSQRFSRSNTNFTRSFTESVSFQGMRATVREVFGLHD
jgi:hypothetical protein